MPENRQFFIRMSLPKNIAITFRYTGTVAVEAGRPAPLFQGPDSVSRYKNVGIAPIL
jgi:hypothetical protein